MTILNKNDRVLICGKIEGFSDLADDRAAMVIGVFEIFRNFYDNVDVIMDANGFFVFTAKPTTAQTIKKSISSMLPANSIKFCWYS